AARRGWHRISFAGSVGRRGFSPAADRCSAGLQPRRAERCRARRQPRRAERNMIMFLVVVLVLLWLLGMVTSYTLGGALHILLVIAIVFLLIRLIRGQPV